jgi:Flp pilus assembly protein CpaB
MSRRARAAAFLVLAVGCAVLAAVIADGYGSSVANSFGPLRRVVVAARDLPAGRPIDPTVLSRSLEVRQVPSRFVPPGALEVADQALGQAPAATVPAGSYLLATQLRPPREAGSAVGPRLAPGRSPVEIAVTGAEALLVAGAPPEGARVDVVVTAEPSGPGPGRTYVAAAGVKLLALREQDPAGPGPSAGWSATLSLSRREALRLIQAESFARQVRLLSRPGG